MKKTTITATIVLSMMMIPSVLEAKPYYSEVNGSEFSFSNENNKANKTVKNNKKHINKNTRIKTKTFVRNNSGATTTGSGDLINKARQYLNKTASQIGLPLTLWCADFMNLITGGGTGSRVAKSYLNYGSPAQKGCTNCIAVISRRGGGHVGVVSGYRNGNPVIISGNYSRRVAEATYPASRVIAYRKVS